MPASFAHLRFDGVSVSFGTHRVPDGWVIVTAGNRIGHSLSAVHNPHD